MEMGGGGDGTTVAVMGWASVETEELQFPVSHFCVTSPPSVGQMIAPRFKLPPGLFG